MTHPLGSKFEQLGDQLVLWLENNSIQTNLGSFVYPKLLANRVIFFKDDGVTTHPLGSKFEQLGDQLVLWLEKKKITLFKPIWVHLFIRSC